MNPRYSCLVGVFKSSPVKSLIINRKYGNFREIFTDGSKSSDGVGSAAVSNRFSCFLISPKGSLNLLRRVPSYPNVCWLHRKLYPYSNRPQNHVIFTDSKSSINSLYNRNNHPVVRYIVHKLHLLKQRGVNIETCWIPSHVGIEENEAADHEAKEVAMRRTEMIKK